MSNNKMGDDLGEDVELEATPRRKGMPGKKIVLFFVLPLLILGGAVVFLLNSGMLDSLMGGGDGTKAESNKNKPEIVYHDLPTILVNLGGKNGQGGFLKLTVSLEVKGSAGAEQVKEVTPRIVDSFQVYLRELRVSDLEGSAGLQRLREELLLRVNNTLGEERVKDVLFKEMLVQ